MKNNKALSLIGLATKAGKTVSGEFSTEKSIKTGKGYLAIVAGDSSDNTKKRFHKFSAARIIKNHFPGTFKSIPWNAFSSLVQVVFSDNSGML